MEFSPFNSIVQLCIQGMELENSHQNEQAKEVFLQAWNEASNDFEQFLAAFYIARHQSTIADKVQWLETAFSCAIKAESTAANSALPTLCMNIAHCYTEMGNSAKAKTFSDLSELHKQNPTDKGPFYHGTKADLNNGDLLVAGGDSNYKSDLKMNHIYFTALVNGAGLAAALAKGDGKERVYIIEPTGLYENDPNLTDKKFPGNPSRSYRSEFPLKIIGEVTEWVRFAPDDLQKFREKLEKSKGEIIN